MAGKCFGGISVAFCFTHTHFGIPTIHFFAYITTLRWYNFFWWFYSICFNHILQGNNLNILQIIGFDGIYTHCSAGRHSLEKTVLAKSWLFSVKCKIKNIKPSTYLMKQDGRGCCLAYSNVISEFSHRWQYCLKNTFFLPFWAQLKKTFSVLGPFWFTHTHST